MDDKVSFSFAAFGIYGATNIIVQGIGFATGAKLVSKDPVWDEVLTLLHAKLNAEAMPAETDPPAAVETPPAKPPRTRKARAETPPVTEPAVSEEAPPAADTGPSLQDALETIVTGEPAAPVVVVDRAALELRVRERATSSADGAAWLREHVMQGAKYPRVSATPIEVLERALAV